MGIQKQLLTVENTLTKGSNERSTNYRRLRTDRWRDSHTTSFHPKMLPSAVTKFTTSMRRSSFMEMYLLTPALKFGSRSVGGMK